MQYLVPLLFLPLFFLSFRQISYGCLEIEKQSLLAFKQSLQDPQNLLDSWTNATNCCHWEGVVCSNVSSGPVRQLLLRGYVSYGRHWNLYGEINPSLLDLKHLRRLDLSHNSFNQTIPSFLGFLSRLEYLNLSSSGFYGKIPFTIGNLSNMRSLSLDYNLVEADGLEWLSGLSRLEHLDMSSVNLGRATDWAQVIDKLPSLVELHIDICHLNYTSSPSPDSVNSSRSSLAFLDLSTNNFDSSPFILGWIFRHSGLVYLDLSYNSFDGPIPIATNSTHLRHIDLSGNSFNSTIPEWLYFCKDLEFVSLWGNHLKGEISDAIANLTFLSILDLSNNKLTGKIPSGIGNLCKMKKLALYGNELQGEISDSFGNMSACFLGALETLDMSRNQLSGHLTRRFGEFISLRSLNLEGNSLFGIIPTNIGNSSSLELLHLDSNKFNGNLPESVGKLSNLTNLYVEDNELEGVVTETHFASLSKLKYFDASRNHLTLEISPQWIPPFELVSLRLGSWHIRGSYIPPWLKTQMNSIQELDLSYTGISGPIPGWLWSINHLNLSHNCLHGEIPRVVSLGHCIYLSSNKLSGPLPRLRSATIELDLSNNLLLGGISRFLCETTMPRMEILHLGGNLLSGEVPNCWSNWTSLTMLNLGNNDLGGRIPSSIGFLVNLQSLNLYRNKFFGGIPFSIKNCTKLEMMDLADNDLNHSLQAWPWASLSNLRFLILRSNMLNGEINRDICQPSCLQILDLSNNRFSGGIPRCLDKLAAMATTRNFSSNNISHGVADFEYSYSMRTFIESASVTVKGVLVHYNTILPLVTIIDLSENNLSGDIPTQITSLVELRSLNLSGNRLTGSIPDNIGNMKQLESLDLSRNFLLGEIPRSFTMMASLDCLNLSSNNLTGKIPDSTQLLSFNESSFAGNNLCGSPLTISCEDKGKARDQEDEGDVWFYVFVTLGYAMGISVFLTTLFLNRPWRQVYFESLESMYDIVYIHVNIKWRMLRRALIE